MDYDYMNIYYPDYLMHYGVKGMKWGHRKYKNQITSNGRSSIKSRALAGAYAATGNKRIGKALDKSNARDAEVKNANTPEAKAARRKKALKVGAAVAGTALAAYGAYKVSEAIKNKNFQIAQEKGSKAFDDYIKNNYAERIRSRVFKDGTSSVDAFYRNGNSSSSVFKNASAANDHYNKLNLRNLEVEREAGDIYSDYIKRASNDSLKTATKNVYDYYKNRRR